MMESAPVPIRRAYHGHSRNPSSGWRPTHNVSRSFSSHFGGAYGPDAFEFIARSPPTEATMHTMAMSCSPGVLDPTFDIERSFFSDFQCCGRSLSDMHELVSHFEESHVMVYDATGKPIYTPQSTTISSTGELLSVPSVPIHAHAHAFAAPPVYSSVTTTTTTSQTQLPTITTSSPLNSANASAAAVSSTSCSPISPNSSIPPMTPSTPTSTPAQTHTHHHHQNGLGITGMGMHPHPRSDVVNFVEEDSPRSEGSAGSPAQYQQYHQQQQQQQMEQHHQQEYYGYGTMNGQGNDGVQSQAQAQMQMHPQGYTHVHAVSPPRISVNTVQVTASAYRFPQAAASPPPPLPAFPQSHSVHNNLAERQHRSPQAYSPLQTHSYVAPSQSPSSHYDVVHPSYPYYYDASSSVSTAPSSPVTTVYSPSTASTFVASPINSRFGFSVPSYSSSGSSSSSGKSPSDEDDVLADFDPLDTSTNANAGTNFNANGNGNGNLTVPPSPVCCLPPSSFTSSPTTTEYECGSGALSRRTSVDDLHHQHSLTNNSNINGGFLTPSLQRSDSLNKSTLSLSRKSSTSSSRKGSLSAASGGGKSNANAKSKSKSRSKSKSKSRASAAHSAVSTAHAAAHAARLSMNVAESRRKMSATSFVPKKMREKAYKCPIEGCTKSYLNPNGLKYHMTKGKCNILDANADTQSLSLRRDGDEDNDLDLDADADADAEGDADADAEGVEDLDADGEYAFAYSEEY